MVIGINIDDVIRDTSTSFYKCYMEEFKDEPSKSISYEDVDLSDLIGSLPFESKKYTENYLNEKNQMVYEEVEYTKEDIFMTFVDDHKHKIYTGSIEEDNLLGYDFNNIVDFFNEQGHEVILLQRESKLTRPLTLYYMSTKRMWSDKIFFLPSFESGWKYCDVIVAANPKFFKNKPFYKKTVKIEKHYNKNIKSDFTIKTIKNIFDIDYFYKKENFYNRLKNKLKNFIKQK